MPGENSVTRANVEAKETALSASFTNWRQGYSRRLLVSDFVVVALAAFGSQFLWGALIRTPLFTIQGRDEQFSYSLFSALLVIAWVSILAFFATRDQRYFGEGSTEYRSVVDASLRVLAVVLLAVFAFQLDMSRGAVLTAFALGIVGLLLERWLWRKWLISQRRAGKMGSRVLIAGSAQSVAHLAAEFLSNPAFGYSVIGVCIPKGEQSVDLERLDVAVLGNIEDIKRTMDETGADTLAIASSGQLTPNRVRELSWQLEPGRQHLVVAPSLTDIGGPRISMRPVAGMPLIHVETPSFEHGQNALKRSLDVALSILLLILLSPVLAITAIAIRLSSPGPVLFHQTRVGLDGATFTMLKFRSMEVGSESLVPAESDRVGEAGNSVMFKLREDPRTTKVGSVIRSYSIDELPQLFNVLRGEMSIVGPRPPLESEVEKYETHVHRRFLMKPGVTGLWQVSGRSNLSWEDSVRLDLYYVENWSLVGDLVILWKTIRAVLLHEGAY
ncbi:MAG: sugar transferase [Rhodoglobus sp.]